MRLFIAAPVPQNVRRALCCARREMEARGVLGRFVPAENYHITLKFLGECSDLVGAAAAMRQAASDAKPLCLRLGEFGVFSTGTLCTGHIKVEDPKGELTRISELLTSALSDCGIRTRKERFLPHITLGRGFPAEVEGVTARREAFTVDSIVLYESTLTKAAPVYEALHREVF